MIQNQKQTLRQNRLGSGAFEEGLRVKLNSALQLPVEHWHEYLADPTLADAILDRIVHQSHKLKLKGESLRKKETT